MARPKENTNRINVFLSDEDYAALRKKADSQGSNVSLIVRSLIKKDLYQTVADGGSVEYHRASFIGANTVYLPVIAENKYSMSVEQNVFVAKRNIVDYIWKSAKLEGMAVTYPETEAIYNGLVVSGMHVDDIQAINNLKHAWRFILDMVDYPTNYPLICKVNQHVGVNLMFNAGFLRNVPVSIGGTSWKPDLPIEAQIKDEIASIISLSNPTDRAVTLMLYLMRKQMFIDGNKRTAMLAGNHVMIAHGAGVLSVPIELQPQFTGMLVRYYETNDMSEIKMFAYDMCIDGIEF